MVQEIGEHEDDEVTERAREALRLYGTYAPQVLTRQAESQFAEGNIVGAFYLRLVVRSIRSLSGLA